MDTVKPDNITPFEKFKNKPVFVTGYPKSGTTLLLSLLDYHPQLLVLPEEPKFFYRVLGAKDKLKAFLESSGLKVFGAGIAKQGHSTVDYTDINYSLFVEKLQKNIQQSKNDKEILLSLVDAWYAVEHSDKKDKRRWISKTPKNIIFFPLMHKWFGNNLICLRVVRDPLDNFTDYKIKQKHITVEKFCLDYAFLESIAKIATRYVKNLHFIQYADLVKNPEKTMRQICDILKIDFNPSLLKPTINGNNWIGNSMHSNKFSGISDQENDFYKNHLTEWEIKKINGLLSGKNWIFNLKLKKKILAYELFWFHPKIYKILKPIYHFIKPLVSLVLRLLPTSALVAYDAIDLF